MQSGSPASTAGSTPTSRPIADVGVFCLAGADLPLDDRRIARQVERPGLVKRRRPAQRHVRGAARGHRARVGRRGRMRQRPELCRGRSGRPGRAVSIAGRAVRRPRPRRQGGWAPQRWASPFAAATGAGRAPRWRRLVPQHFRMARPASVMEALYVGRLDGQRMLEDLAPVVFKAAGRGDAVARELIDELADEVVATANAAIRRLRIGVAHLRGDPRRRHLPQRGRPPARAREPGNQRGGTARESCAGSTRRRCSVRPCWARPGARRKAGSGDCAESDVTREV